MGKGRFASTGVVVGRTTRDRSSQKTEHLKGNKVTMGKNVPRQDEGSVGDITVRDISGVGLRAYIKTNSGWYDINAMRAPFMPNWINMNLAAGWGIDSTYGTPQYMKDSHGFVHLRGGVDSGSHANTITTLPEGYRPKYEQRRIVLATLTSGLNVQQIRIQSTGVINKPYSTTIIQGGGSDDIISVSTTAEICLDGISFFSGKIEAGIDSGGEFETSPSSPTI